MGSKRIKMLGLKSKISDLNKFEMEFCEQYFLGRQMKFSFAKDSKSREVGVGVFGCVYCLDIHKCNQ